MISLFFFRVLDIICLFIGIILFVYKYIKERSSFVYVVFYSIFPLVQFLLLKYIGKFANERISGKNQILIVLGSIFGIMGDIYILHILLVNPEKDSLSQKADEIIETISLGAEKYTESAGYLKVISDEEMEYEKLLENVMYEAEAGHFNDAKSFIRNFSDKNISNSYYLYCTNQYVDAILCEKAKICNQEGIEFVVSANVPKTLCIKPVILCSIFGNLLDNAIHSCNVFTQKEKKIELRTGINGEYFVLFLENSADDNSQRKDLSRKHYGNQIINDYVKEYQGHYFTTYNRAKKIYKVEVALWMGENDLY